MSPGKPITNEGLAQDLDYVLNGVDCHAVLASICLPRAGLKVLEPGCGSGKLGLWYALRGADATMLDIDPGVLAYAKALAQKVVTGVKTTDAWLQSHAHYRKGSILNLSRIFGHQFDFVFNEGVPQHWTDWRRQASINQMAKVTKPGGWVCVIGSNGHCQGMMDYAARIDAGYMGMPPKQKPWEIGEITARLLRAGLVDVQVIPVGGEWSNSMLLAAWGRKP